MNTVWPARYKDGAAFGGKEGKRKPRRGAKAKGKARRRTAGGEALTKREQGEENDGGKKGGKRCASKVYEDEPLRGGKDGARGNNGVEVEGQKGGQGEAAQRRTKAVGVCIADLFPPTHSSWRI